MNCTKCGHTETRVIRTTVDEDGDEITRHRECKECGHRFHSYEGTDRAPSTCDDEAVLRELRKALVWLRPVARNIPVVRDSIRLLELCETILAGGATSSI